MFPKTYKYTSKHIIKYLEYYFNPAYIIYK